MDLGWNFRQHGEAAAYVKPPNAHRYIRSAQRSGNVHGAWKLVRLHANERHQPTFAARPNGARHTLRPDARVDLVLNGDLDFHLVAEHSTVDALARDAIQGRKRIGRDDRSHPLDDVTIIIVMGGFDQEEPKDSPPLVGRVASGNLISFHSDTPSRLLT